MVCSGQQIRAHDLAGEMRENDHTLLILLGLYLLSKYSFEIVPKLENAGSKTYDVLHNDGGHKKDLPANEVPANLTAMTPSEARRPLNFALTQALGRNPTPQEISMLLAQSDFETATWRSLHNYNFGNLEVTPGHPWYRLGSNPQHFRSYVSADEGATGMVYLIKNRYPKAFSLLGSGDPAAYAAALKERGYYTAPLALYTAGMRDRYKRHLAKGGAE